MAVHLTAALEQDLHHLAAESNSTADELAQRALEDFVAYRKDLNEAVRRGDADIAAGRVLDHEEVFARLNARLQGK
jgi:predicted transcriptional regulator